jgi:hypothetical protein
MITLLIFPALVTSPGPKPRSPNPSFHQTSRNGVADNQPVGNGEVVANVWAENSTLGLLLGRSDVFSGFAAPLKLGRVLLNFQPNPFEGKRASYSQVLDLRTATVRAVMQNGEGLSVEVAVWSDINGVEGNANSVHVSVNSSHPVVVTARVDLWRTQFVNQSWTGARGPCGTIPLWPDTIIPLSAALPDGQVGWFHRNPVSQYVYTLNQQMLGGLANATQDPLLNRTSGALLVGGSTFTTKNETAVVAREGLEHELSILTQTAITRSAGEWIAQLRDGASGMAPAAATRGAHEAWWIAFWERSWIVTAPAAVGQRQLARAATSVGNYSAVTAALSRAYDLTRYLTAIQSRGQLPIHHNGGTVTWGWDGKSHADPDERPWGGGYWFQNTRHLYWYTLGAGDLDLLAPMFGMYSRQLPLLSERTRQWYNHSGTTFGETSYFFGAYEPVDYGCERYNVPEAQSPYIRHYWQGGAELSVIMLQAFTHSNRTDNNSGMLLKDIVLPWVVSMLTFYDEHYPKDANGSIWLKDAQACETWPNCTNPTPQVAALHRICELVLALPPVLVGPADVAFFRRLCVSDGLPDIPRTADGLLSPCQGGFPTTHVNSENVETYAIWPYELFAVNRTTDAKWPLAVAKASFQAARFGHYNTAWRYDGQDAAIMGMASYALSMIEARVTEQGTCDNSGFPGYLASDTSDGAPQLESNGIVSVTLQKMLIQTEGRRILLFPAWLDGLDVDAKLHFPSGPGGATAGWLHVKLVSGNVTVLEVVPSSRLADVEVLELQRDLPPAPSPPAPPSPPPPPVAPCHPPIAGPNYIKHDGLIGTGPVRYVNCSSGWSACPAVVEAYCNATASCRSFAIDPAFPGGGEIVAVIYSDGLNGATVNPAWTLWVRQCAPPPPPPAPCNAPTSGPQYIRHEGMIGSGQTGIFNCSSGSSACPTEVEAYCNATASCRSFAIDPAFPGGGMVFAETYSKGLDGATVNPAWTLWVRQCGNDTRRVEQDGLQGLDGQPYR